MRPSEFKLTTPGSLRLFSTIELLKLPPPEWLIDHAVPEGGLAVIYGPPGVGKTFVALDMVLKIATGMDWFGKKVKKQLPLYVSAEGGSGIGKRVATWLDYHSVDGRKADVMWLLDTLPLYNGSSEVDRLMERIDEVERKPGVVVVDTLARCFDGDENQQQDMGRFIGGVDHLRREFNATVIVVHHTRLGGDRERGNTALRGAADAMIAITGEEDSPQFQITCDKQKDGERFETIELRRRPVSTFDSCVILGEQNETLRLVKNAVIQAKKPISPKDLLKAVVSHDISRATLFRYLAEMVKTGEIIREKGEYRINEV